MADSVASFPGSQIFGEYAITQPARSSSETVTLNGDSTEKADKVHSSATTQYILQDFHNKRSLSDQQFHKANPPTPPPQAPSPRAQSSVKVISPKTKPSPPALVRAPHDEVDPEDPWSKVHITHRRRALLPRCVRAKLGTCVEEPSMDELARRVEYFLSCRGNLIAQIYDFGEGRTKRKLVRLGDIERGKISDLKLGCLHYFQTLTLAELFEKPDWAVVRWM